MKYEEGLRTMDCEHVVGRGLPSYHQSDQNQPVSFSLVADCQQSSKLQPELQVQLPPNKTVRFPDSLTVKEILML